MHDKIGPLGDEIIFVSINLHGMRPLGKYQLDISKGTDLRPYGNGPNYFALLNRFSGLV